MTIKSLSEIECGIKGRVIGIDLCGDIRRHLSDMGLAIGSEVQMQRTAPLGDPIEIKLKGYSLTLRKETASRIMVEMDNVPLTMVCSGKSAAITGLNAGSTLLNRLSDMGLAPGTQVEIIENRHRGPLMINLNNTRLTLGRGMASKIIAREI